MNWRGLVASAGGGAAPVEALEEEGMYLDLREAQVGVKAKRC